MSGELLRPDLTRAWANYFGIKGGVQPNVPSEIVPVIVLDSNEQGPYPPYRVWIGELITTATGGLFTFFAVVNSDDPKTQKSAVIVDRLFVQNLTGVTKFAHGLAKATGGPISLAPAPTSEVDAGKELWDTIITDPKHGNIMLGNGSTATPGIVASRFPAAPIGVTVEIPGPFILAPNTALLVCSDSLASSIHCYARGRYYPSL